MLMQLPAQRDQDEGGNHDDRRSERCQSHVGHFLVLAANLDGPRRFIPLGLLGARHLRWIMRVADTHFLDTEVHASSHRPPARR